MSGILFQLGAALLAAGVVKAYVDQGLSLESASWIFVAAVLIWVGWLWLGLLESET